MNRLLAPILSVLLSISTHAFADVLDDVVSAYNRGDYALAVRLLRPLAEQGNANAQLRLGHMYSNGQGVPQSYQQEAFWYLKAAEQGIAEAQYLIGSLYEYGSDIPQDCQKAVFWYRKAAGQGQFNALLSLGVMYERGLCVQQNYVQAHMWFNLLAARGDNYWGPSQRDRVVAKMTLEQIAEAQRLAQEWMTSHGR